MNRFGQCCLLARRLIEAGVRFVTVNTFLTVFDEITWDIHGSKPFTSIEGMTRHRRPDVRPGLQRPARRPRASAACSTTRWCATWPSSAARRGSIRPADATTGRSAGRVYFAGGGVQGRPRRRRAAIAIGGCARRAARRAGRNRGHDLPQPGLRPGNRRCPARPAGRSRWSISASTRLRSCFKRRSVEASCYSPHRLKIAGG